MEDLLLRAHIAYDGARRRHAVVLPGLRRRCVGPDGKIALASAWAAV